MKELVLVVMCATFAYTTAPPGGEPLLPVVGHIAPGLPAFTPPYGLAAPKAMLLTHERLPEFIVGGFLVALTSFLTTYAASKRQALHHGYHIDASQDVRPRHGWHLRLLL